MTKPIGSRPLGSCLLALGLAAAIPLAAAPASAAAVGYVRLAHLSPDTPAVDVYLYSFGATTARLVIPAVPYGALSPYQRLADGQYTVAMRAKGAKASSPPVLSTNVRVRAGRAYTVAGMGPFKGIHLDVLPDTVKVPDGKAAVRVIAASLKAKSLKVTFGSDVLAGSIDFATTSPYQVRDAATGTVSATASGEKASRRLALTPGSVHTVVVLDGKSGLRLLDVRDAAGPGNVPLGGVDTGLGGLSVGSSGADGTSTDGLSKGGPGAARPWPALAAALVALAAAVTGAAVLVRRRGRVG